MGAFPLSVELLTNSELDRQVLEGEVEPRYISTAWLVVLE